MKNFIPRPSAYYRADQPALAAHTTRMDAGCLECRAAVLGHVCPDCYLCRSCGEGCDECAEVRAPR
jgi:hypothetical protein